MTRDATHERRNALAVATLEVIGLHFRDPKLELRHAATELGSRKRTIQRALSESGASWRKALTERRMQEAARLLVSTDRPVHDIAYDIGYRQAAQFAKTFRRHTGRTPSEYRRGAAK